MTDFGGDGIAQSVAIDSHGRIVVAGTVAGLGGGGGFALARYRRSGSLDPSFGSGGKVVTDFGRYDAADAVAIDSQGRIVVAGSVRLPDPPRDNFAFALARYTPDGSLDPSFSGDGKLTTDFGGLPTTPTRWPSTPGSNRRRRPGIHGRRFDFALARYNPTAASTTPSAPAAR